MPSNVSLKVRFTESLPGDSRQMTGRFVADSSHTLSILRGTASTYLCPKASDIKVLAAISALSSLQAYRSSVELRDNVSSI